MSDLYLYYYCMVLCNCSFIYDLFCILLKIITQNLAHYRPGTSEIKSVTRFMNIDFCGK